MLNEVVIVGAGPTGLMLARELQLAGVTPLVLERAASPNREPRALGLGGRTIDILERRGLLARFEAAAAEAPALPPSLFSNTLAQTPKLMHFGGIPLDLRQLPGAMPRFLNLLQNRTDQCFEACAIEAGVTIQRGHELRALEQTEDEVLLIVTTPEGERRIRTRFVVGCDGAHSVVRKLADIPFPGLAPTRVLRLGDLKLPAEQPPSPAGWRGGRPGFIPLADGFTRIVTNEPLPADLDRNAPMTFDELRESVRRLFDIVLVPTEIRWVSRFTDASRLAERYRSGRVLHAGDAAHVHLPAGGPGINAGINDAMNLGWKLAAAVRGTAPDGLLDTYHSERHAEGERLMSQTRAQGAMLQQTSVGAALREIVGGFLAHPAVLRDVVDLQQGTCVRYATDGEAASELVGCWAPDLMLESPNAGRTCISDQMRGGRALFVELMDRSLLVDAVRPYTREVDVFVGSSPGSDSAVEALLIRPDGHVAWACERGEDSHTAVLGLERALQKWFTSSSPASA